VAGAVRVYPGTLYTRLSTSSPAARELPLKGKPKDTRGLGDDAPCGVCQMRLHTPTHAFVILSAAKDLAAKDLI